MMVDAKVDIRRLQLLNDRIAQVTDALNQVRLSVHGLTHTGAPMVQPLLGVPLGGLQPQFGFPQQIPYALGQPVGFQHAPYYPGVSPAAPFGQPVWQSGPQPAAGGGFGLQHTAYSPFGPFGQGPQGIGQFPGWGGTSAWTSPFGGGLYHSPELMEQRVIEQRTNDPNRILQTFPFCLAPLSAATAW
jgi:hypothetical protein